MRRRILALVIGALALAVGLAAGGTFAYWTNGGSGDGSATVATPQAVTVDAATGTPSSNLIPGGTADLVLELTNPNVNSVTLVGISQRGTTVTPVGATGPGTACTSSNTGVSVPTRTDLSISVPAGANITVHIPGAVAMSTSSASGCQGATFQVPVNVTVHR